MWSELPFQFALPPQFLFLVLLFHLLLHIMFCNEHTNILHFHFVFLYDCRYSPSVDASVTFPSIAALIFVPSLAPISIPAWFAEIILVGVLAPKSRSNNSFYRKFYFKIFFNISSIYIHLV